METGGEHGTFLFDVTDGVIVLSQRTFRIHSTPPTLSMTSQRPLEVFPGVDQPITWRVLRAVTDDVVQSRTIIYTVVSAPRRGELRDNVGPTDKSKRFLLSANRKNLGIYAKR